MLDGGCFSGPISAAAIGTALSTTLKISSITYELKAVSENAKDLLDSTKHVSDNLQTAKTLRRQKSMHFNNGEKKWIDGVLASTEKTLSNVAILIEPARVDMQTKFGSVGLLNRGLFVFRDSPKVQTHLARLSIASGSLDTVLNVLCTREGRSTSILPRPESSSWSNLALLKRKSCASLRSEVSIPPAYQDTDHHLTPIEELQGHGPARCYGEEPSPSMITELSPNLSKERFCHATMGRQSALPPTETTFEWANPSTKSSSSYWHDKLPTAAIQEVSELECYPIRSPRSADFSDRSASVSSTSTTPIPVHELQTQRSARSLRNSASSTISSTRENIVTVESSIRPTGRQRGRAWMAHQANK